MAIEFYDDLQVYHSDGSYALLRGQGLFLNRSNVYVAPLADNFSTLNIGYDGAKWGNVEINAATVKFENGANEFARIDSSGNVGIGTTSPAEKIDVQGNIKLRGTNNLTIGSTSDGGNFSLSSGIRGFNFANNNGDLVRIDGDGKVGIGTTSPDEKLRVDGNIKSAGDFIGSALKLGFAGSANITTNDTNEDLLINPNGSGDILMQTTSTGNVGIGTTSPSEKLHVDGNIRTNSTQGYYGSFLQAISSTGLKIGNDDFSGYAFFHNDGNVGISTTSPAEKLTVSGAANITGKFAVGIAATHASFDFYNQGTAYLNGAVTVDDTLDLVNLKVSGAQGTDGQVLTSTGSGVAWEDVSSSPWVTDTNGITYTAGNVGIGTASQASLDLAVGGAARFNSDVRFDADVQCAGGDLIVSNSLKDVNSATGTSGQILSSEGAGGGVEWINAGIKSSASGEPSGSDSVINIVSLTQAEYDNGTPVATTLYIIT